MKNKQKLYNGVFILAKTPRAGAFNHRYALARTLPEEVVKQAMENLENQDDTLLVYSQTVTQMTTGRRGEESVAVFGVDSARLTASEREKLHGLLQQCYQVFSDLVQHKIDWQRLGKDQLLVVRQELQAFEQQLAAFPQKPLLLSTPATAKKPAPWFLLLAVAVLVAVGGIVYMNNPSTGEQPAPVATTTGNSGVETPAEIVKPKITPLCDALKGYACAVAQQEAAYSQQLRAALADFYVILADKTAHVAAMENMLSTDNTNNKSLASDLAFLKAVNLPPLPVDYRTQSEAGQSADDKKVIEALRDALRPDPTASDSLFDRTFAYKPLEDKRNKLFQLLK